MDGDNTRYGSDKDGLLCGYAFTPDEGGRSIDADEAARLVAQQSPGDDASFLWLHFNLANQATRRWIGQHLVLPEAFHAALDQVTSTRIEVADGSIVAVLNDVALFGAETSDASAMALCVSERLLVSARRTPLRSVDRLRESVRRGERFRSSLELLAHLLRDQAAMLVQAVRHAATQIDDVEDRLIANDVGSSRPRLGTLRRTLVKLQRLLAAEPAAIFRLLVKPPAWMGAADLADVRESAEQIAAASADCSALVDRIKLLQEEVFAVVSEQTNRTLFTLTVVTVLALPMTIVSSFFGMNVAGVPLQGGGGFWIVVVLTIATSALVALLLYRGRNS